MHCVYTCDDGERWSYRVRSVGKVATNRLCGYLGGDSAAQGAGRVRAIKKASGHGVGVAASHHRSRKAVQRQTTRDKPHLHLRVHCDAVHFTYFQSEAEDARRGGCDEQLQTERWTEGLCRSWDARADCKLVLMMCLAGFRVVAFVFLFLVACGLCPDRRLRVGDDSAEYKQNVTTGRTEGDRRGTGTSTARWECSRRKRREGRGSRRTEYGYPSVGHKHKHRYGQRFRPTGWPGYEGGWVEA